MAELRQQTPPCCKRELICFSHRVEIERRNQSLCGLERSKPSFLASARYFSSGSRFGGAFFWATAGNAVPKKKRTKAASNRRRMILYIKGISLPCTETQSLHNEPVKVV